MDVRSKLVDLLDYTEQLAKIGERAVFRVADYRSVSFFEHELCGRIGIHLDVLEGEDQSWLKVERLTRRDPPPVPQEIREWITVGRDPFKQPVIQNTRVVTVRS